MICSGLNALNGDSVEIEFSSVIQTVRPGDREARVWLSPGFIDIQVNGFGGVDFNNPDVSMGDIGRAIETILGTGVTRCLPTVITGPPDAMLGCLRNLARAREEIQYGSVIAGFHIEGPHIGEEDGPRGAHPRRWVRPPDIEEYRRWQDATSGLIRLITLSPHWPEAPAYIEAITRDGVTASVGHTGATSDQIAAAAAAGAILSTHLGNGAHGVMRKHPNYIWDQLAEDRLNASFIADGIHVGHAFLQTALRAKTVNRSILVTDASAPAGARSGRYQLGEQAVDLTEDGRVVLAGTDRLAGSALRMSDAIANAVRLGRVTVEEAIRMATLNPARVVGLADRIRGLEPMETADIVAFRFNDGALAVESVWLAGERVGRELP
jgi:N-acetylglucosamine-6-phosphate deacetylase